MSRSPSRFRRRLAIENLESRQQLAGMVELALDGTTWTLTGDAAANGIEIEQQAPGDFLIKGTYQGGEITKIKLAGFDNFVDTTFRVLGEVSNLNVNLGGASDRLRIVGRGPGIDALRVNSMLNINTADGDDEVEMKYAVVRNLLMDLGAGNDKASMYGIELPPWGGWYYSFPSIVTGAGKDRVEVEGSQFRFLRVDTGADNDAVVVQEVTATSMQILTGAGQDELAVVGSEFASRLTIDTGADNDQAALFAVSADEIFAQMGDGDDYLYLVANEARAAKLLGGNGKDVLDFDPFIGINNEFEQLGIDGFETIQ
jgi:hypothetical protein